MLACFQTRPDSVIKYTTINKLSIAKHLLQNRQ